ncbi:hypothetical protein [Streptomyces monashensis]|uniref:hypothetical protein n=1 Tax=Streptomyces monashensis TaxID=1678012 RepID=UPI003F53F40F
MNAADTPTTVYTVDAVRTPIGRCDGALASARPDDLATPAIHALPDRSRPRPGSRTSATAHTPGQAGHLTIRQLSN